MSVCSFQDRVKKYKDLKERLNKISKNHVSYLETYSGTSKIGEKWFYGFSRPRIKEEDDYLQAGLLSTCFVISSLKKAKSQNEVKRKLGEFVYPKARDLILNKEWSYFTQHDTAYYAEDKFLVFEEKDIVNRKGVNDGRIFVKPKGQGYDLYSSPIILTALADVGLKYEDSLDKNDNVKSSIEYILKKINNDDGAARYSKNYPKSGFLTYNSFIALTLWYNIIKEQNKETKKEEYQNLLEKIDDVLFQMFIWAKEQIYKQISFYGTENFERTDPIRCIFTISVYKKYFEHVKNDPIRYDIRKMNNDLINKIINYVFSDQQQNGLWKKYLPVFALPNDGNVYPFALYSMNTLLSITDPSVKLFNEFTSNIESAVSWIELSEKENPIKPEKLIEDQSMEMEEKITVPEKSRKKQGKYTVKGWRSNHSTNPFDHPQSWSTSLVFDSILSMERVVKRSATKDIVNEFKGEFEFEVNRKEFFDRTDGYYYLKNDSQTQLSLKKTIFSFFLYPRISEKYESTQLPNATILYGPPGTGKTSLIESIAKFLGWSYLRVDTSIFLRDGLDRASNNIDKLFETLIQLDRTVILFDEIDEFIQDRERNSENISKRLLTNTMLTKLNDLKKNKNILYFVSTNCIGTVDEAIKRPGRFDCTIKVGFLDIQSLKDLTQNLLLKESKVRNANDKNFPTKINKILCSMIGGFNKKNVNVKPNVDATFDKWKNFVHEVFIKYQKSEEDDTVITTELNKISEQFFNKPNKSDEDPCQTNDEISSLSGINYKINEIQMGGTNEDYDTMRKNLREHETDPDRKIPFFSKQFEKIHAECHMCPHDAKVKMPGYLGIYECTRCHKFIQ